MHVYIKQGRKDEGPLYFHNSASALYAKCKTPFFPSFHSSYFYSYSFVFGFSVEDVLAIRPVPYVQPRHFFIIPFECARARAIHSFLCIKTLFLFWYFSAYCLNYARKFNAHRFRKMIIKNSYLQNTQAWQWGRQQAGWEQCWDISTCSDAGSAYRCGTWTGSTESNEGCAPPALRAAMERLA